MQYKFNLEALKNIPILEVLSSFGINQIKGKFVTCLNYKSHNNNDHKPSMYVNMKQNTCKCFACNLGGNSIEIAKFAFNGDFKKACEFLHSQFNIPFLDNSIITSGFTAPSFKAPKKEVQYMNFLRDKQYQSLKVAELMPKYKQEDRLGKLKILYSFVYRYSLMTNQAKKEEYYKNRGIQAPLDKIGFLSYADVKSLEKSLISFFPLEDLTSFKIFNKNRVGWNYGYDIAIVPCFDLYSDLITGFSVRSLNPNNRGAKELNVFCSDIVYPMPFNLTNENLRNKDFIWICEGHIDALSGISSSKREDVCFISFAGVYTYKDEILGLLRGKNVMICFDNDTAGKQGGMELGDKLKKLGVNTFIASWDNNYNDLNDLLKANALADIKLNKVA
ncbi:hypothetical protein HPU229336_06310 [Helicobacter pullorum]|uniref:Zinc finger CHC2-type domain-containing protein n=1 Tax=Helicobacter pullorum TaxID=35818 RepID=A0AAW3J478_9HELI|nr:toprim domain-containing protein [Helicobacter pullorum]KPH51488.1 hypothetical protein HPU229336_06310 [Helicobacter pullorum]